jgi:general secretion pathway protein L
VKLNNYSDLPLNNVPNTHVEAQTLELPMAVLATEAMAVSFNLFQGDYKAKKKTNNVWQQWRVAIVLAVAALLVGIVDKTLTLQQLSSQNETLKAQINQQVKSGFPNMGGYRDLRRKVASELAKLEQGGGSASMLVMLSQLSPAFSASDLKPQSIRFDSGRQELRLQAFAANFDSLERFKRQAEEAGFTVEQGAINNIENGVVGSLAIRSNA